MQVPSSATLTGRCRTQWLADKLSAHYSDMAVVPDEPFRKDDQPRRYFATYHRGEDVPLSATRWAGQIWRRFRP